MAIRTPDIPVEVLQGDGASKPLADEMGHLGDENIRPGGLSLGEAPQRSQDSKRAVGRFDMEYVSFQSSTTEFRVDHDLGRVPSFWITVWKDGFEDLRPGTRAWTSDSVFFIAQNGSVQVTVALG